jgi:hypothetical protein
VAKLRRGREIVAVPIVVGAAVLLAGCTGAASTSTRTLAPSDSTTTTTPPSTTTTTAAATNTAAATSSIDFSGKYAIYSVSFPNVRDGFALLGGYPTSGGASRTWLDHTTNAGRSWTSQPFDDPQSFIAFNTPAVGWAYPGLAFTKDGGSHWRRVPDGRNVISVVVSGNFTWFLSQRNVSAKNAGCDSSVLRSTRLGAAPTPVPNEPDLGSSCLWQLVVTAPATAYLVGSEGGDRAPVYFLTTNGGASWSRRSTPCPRQPPSTASMAGSGETLLLSCSFGRVLDTSGDQAAVIFGSTDGGSSWRPVHDQPIYLSGLRGDELVQASPSLVWSWSEFLGGGAGYAGVSRDGGRQWSTIISGTARAPGFRVTPPLGQVSSAIPQALAVRGSFAAVAVKVYGTAAGQENERFLVGVTKDEGRDWSWAYLPGQSPPSTSPPADSPPLPRGALVSCAGGDTLRPLAFSFDGLEVALTVKNDLGGTFVLRERGRVVLTAASWPGFPYVVSGPDTRGSICITRMAGNKTPVVLYFVASGAGAGGGESFQALYPSKDGRYRQEDSGRGPVSAIKILGGSPAIVAGNPRFAYTFADGAGTAFPILITRIVDGSLIDVTDDFPSLIEQDAQSLAASTHTQWFKADGVQGFMGETAAWVADECRIGHGASAWRYAEYKVAHGQFRVWLNQNVPDYIKQTRCRPD